MSAPRWATARACTSPRAMARSSGYSGTVRHPSPPLSSPATQSAPAPQLLPLPCAHPQTPRRTAPTAPAEERTAETCAARPGVRVRGRPARASKRKRGGGRRGAHAARRTPHESRRPRRIFARPPHDGHAFARPCAFRARRGGRAPAADFWERSQGVGVAFAHILPAPSPVMPMLGGVPDGCVALRCARACLCARLSRRRRRSGRVRHLSAGLRAGFGLFSKKTGRPARADRRPRTAAGIVLIS